MPKIEIVPEIEGQNNAGAVAPEDDCFGTLYDPLIEPCLSRCAVKRACHRELMIRLAIDARKPLRSIYMGGRTVKEPRLFRQPPARSKLVARVTAFIAGQGLTVRIRQQFISFKSDRRVLLLISRFTSNDLNNLVRFRHPIQVSEFPKSIRHKISMEDNTEHLTLIAKDWEDFKTSIKIYIGAQLKMDDN